MTSRQNMEIIYLRHDMTFSKRYQPQICSVVFVASHYFIAESFVNKFFTVKLHIYNKKRQIDGFFSKGSHNVFYI